MASIIVPDNYSPIKVGDTLYPFAPQFVTYNSSGVAVALNLTGLTISMKMRNETTGAVKTCAASWVVDNAAAGQAHYPWTTSDVDTDGVWTMFIALTNNQGQVAHAFTKDIVIEATP